MFQSEHIVKMFQPEHYAECSGVEHWIFELAS